MRFGLRTAHQRQWTPRGIRPVWTTKLCYEFGYLYAAIEPLKGQVIAAFLPDMRPESYQAFLDVVADEVETGILLYQDQAGTHRAEEVMSASHVHCRSIPPYSPELNPCERLFEEIRKKIANTVFSSLAEIEAVLSDALWQYWRTPTLLTRLTAYPWIRKAPKYN
jgi:transposase